MSPLVKQISASSLNMHYRREVRIPKLSIINYYTAPNCPEGLLTVKIPVGSSELCQSLLRNICSTEWRPPCPRLAGSVVRYSVLLRKADRAARLTNSQQPCTFQAMANHNANFQPRGDALIAGLDLLHSRPRKSVQSLVGRSSSRQQRSFSIYVDQRSSPGIATDII